MQVETQEMALFRSTRAALAFAFNFTHGQYKPSAMATMMGGARPEGRGLGGLDGAGTAGLIRAKVDALEPRNRGQILIARFAVQALPCDCRHACCSGFRANAEWLKAIAEISAAARTVLAGCQDNFRLRSVLVRRYFGDQKSLVDAACAAAVDRGTASAHARKVTAYLKGEERQARYAIEGPLKAAGIVE
ncbi:MAG: hypothetical protein HY661_07415 [Betaproteobacteria bacterium]|nr:hypothetical protein [Betaproteobacteria bacterium]